MKISLKTPLTELHKYRIGNLSGAMSRKLASAVGGYANKSDISRVVVEDLLDYFPARYEDRSNMMPIEELYNGLEASVELYARVSGGFRVGKNRSRKAPPLFIFEITASDRQRLKKPVVIWWFLSGKGAHQIVNYWKAKFHTGTRFVAYGKWEWDARRNTFALKISKPNEELEILPGAIESGGFGLFEDVVDDPENQGAQESGSEQIDSETISEETAIDEDKETPELAMVHVGRRVPVYRKLGPFQTKRLREIVFSALQNIDPTSQKDPFPHALRERQQLISRIDAIKEIHFPPEDSSLIDYAAARSPAHKRLIFEEFFWVSLVLRYKRSKRTKETKGTKIIVDAEIKKRIRSILPFELTAAQKRVTETIYSDLQSNSPMNRLIQGDVGSGKTIVAFLAMAAAVENGYQTALMAPTEILAEQHARNAAKLFEKLEYRIEILTGSLRAARKREVHKRLAAGEIDMIIGTHAIIQDTVAFKNLGLAVIDEQHRFGVIQRGELKERGLNPDILVMTATPIPRSLAMTVYGDLDVSVIDELPPGRTPVKTVVVGEDQRKGVYKGIARELSLGRQVYIVYPLIEESEKMDLKAATGMFEELRDRSFPDNKIGLLHGKMKADEKDAVMKDFSAGKIDILVSTTVIEVGVDVPNASLMIIEHAERFGLSQLHQLRGRVGRGAEQSFCVLLTDDKKTSVAKERLGIMEKTSDGFKISEKDLEIRGQGDILGTRQSGIQTFKIGNIVRDIEILEKAKMEADAYLNSKRDSDDANDLIEIVKSDVRFEFATIG
ncbi:MAG: ATP-dependent DNA helicase RecG [Pyrinomonadaceae bacterium]